MAEQVTIPNHVAIILDGNRRWAHKSHVPIVEGYRRSYSNIVEIARHLWNRGVSVVTIWGFSTENWKRSEQEINPLMELFLGMDSHVDLFVKNKVRVNHLGRKDRLPDAVVGKIQVCENATKEFDSRYLNIAIDYGGHDELIRACNLHLERFPNKPFTEESFAECLDTGSIPFPNPDLLIRTGGEKRLSGFMSWQSAYSELAFIEDFLPDVTTSTIDQILSEFDARQRRFGK